MQSRGTESERSASWSAPADLNPKLHKVARCPQTKPESKPTDYSPLFGLEAAVSSKSRAAELMQYRRPVG